MLRNRKQLPNPTKTEPKLEIVEPTVNFDLSALDDLGEKEKEQRKEKTELPKYQPKIPYPVKIKKDQQVK